MTQLSIVSFWCLVAIAVYNAIWALVTVSAIRRRRRDALVADKDLPKTAVLLCLRGADPSLETCLHRLLKQDYPRFELFIAVDSETDPAWEVVRRVTSARKAVNVRICTLRNRRSTCSLKCSALVQLIDQLDASHQVIALADADLESHPRWLRELVAPLVDPKIGATFGNRWFLPARGAFGSVIRQLWNGPGLVVMHLLQIPWAGSLAIRSDVFNHSRLREQWARSIVDDGPIRKAVKARRLRLHFVPTLLMPNREDCSFTFAYSFLRRQMTWTRTYVRGWWLILLTYMFLCIGMLAFSSAMALISYLAGSLNEAFNFVAGVAIFAAGSCALWLLLESCARRVIRDQGEAAATVFSTRLSRIAPAMLVACGVALFAAVTATVRRRVTWRGVTYEIRGPADIRIVNDGQSAPALASTALSI